VIERLAALLRLRALILVLAAGTLVALASLTLYGLTPVGRNGSCPAFAKTVARLSPLARGEVAAFRVADHAERLPDLGFAGPDGARLRLSAFRGRSVLLNLWATWCEPCKREMPALDQLEAELGGTAFEVVAVNIDTRRLERPRQWLEEAGVRRLRFYSDSEARIFRELREIGQAEGMPTTLLIDPDGCRLGTLAGPAEWSGPDAVALIRAALQPSEGVSNGHGSVTAMSSFEAEHSRDRGVRHH
jgi:thiol-disulfide isomerase/thioredoxin